MALTITNVNSLNLLNILNRTQQAQSTSLYRLSTGLRINRGMDDPAGLLAIKALESELTSVNAAIVSNQRTDAMLSVADKSLDEVSSLLGEIQSLAAASSNQAGLTGSQLAANQSQIDNAIASIDRIIRTTEFNGAKLLDGTLGINVSGGTTLDDIHVYSRNPNAASNTLNVAVQTVASQAATSGTGYVANNSASEATTITVKGALGTQVIEIAANENLSSITAKINDVTAMTGVTASQTGAAAAIHLKSSAYGSDAFVKVSIIEGGTQNGSGTFNSVDEAGVDAAVTINGQTAAADGKQVFFSLNGLSLSFKLSATSNVADYTTSFTVDSDGGATFQLGTDSSMRVTLGIDGFYSQQLGTGVAGETLSALKSGGTYDLVSDPAKAAEIAAEARSQVATLQGAHWWFPEVPGPDLAERDERHQGKPDLGQEHHR